VPDCGPERSRGANLTSEVLDMKKKTGADKEMSVAVMCFSVGATKSSVTKGHGRGTRTFCQLPVSVVVVRPSVPIRMPTCRSQRNGVRSPGLQTQNASSPRGSHYDTPEMSSGSYSTRNSDIDCVPHPHNCKLKLSRHDRVAECFLIYAQDMHRIFISAIQ
jgi:hypothetical protein